MGSSTRQSGRAPGTRDAPHVSSPLVSRVPHVSSPLVSRVPHVEAFLQLGASLDETEGQDDPLRRDGRSLAVRGLHPPSPDQHAALVARGGGALCASTPETREPISVSFTPPQLSLRSGNITGERVNYFGEGRREALSPAGAMPVPAAGCELVDIFLPTSTLVARSFGTPAGPAGAVAGTPIADHGVGLDQPVLANSGLSGWPIEQITRGEHL